MMEAAQCHRLTLAKRLFKPRFKHPETSTLVRRFSSGRTMPAHAVSAETVITCAHWYRMINRLMWIWRGVDAAVRSCDVQARIVMSECRALPTAELYDTVVGYRGGNWIYEWSKAGDALAAKSDSGSRSFAERSPLAARLQPL